jgi:hypothetical protein
MATTKLPHDFKEFLRLLNANQIEYLLIGGYAVGYHGYVRATADMDIWVRIDPPNADRLVVALGQFGFDVPALAPELFLQANKIVRMGVPPFRIEVHTSISGVEFEQAYARRLQATIDGIEVALINLDDLKSNKKASGRTKDLVDLEHLP